MAKKYVEGASYRLLSGTHYRMPSSGNRREREQVKAGGVFEPTEAEFEQNRDRLEIVHPSELEGGDAEAGDSGPDATPAAASLADDEKIDLTTIEGTGADGRIVVKDVEAAISARDAAAEEAKADEGGDAEAGGDEGEAKGEGEE